MLLIIIINIIKDYICIITYVNIITYKNKIKIAVNLYEFLYHLDIVS